MISSSRSRDISPLSLPLRDNCVISSRMRAAASGVYFCNVVIFIRLSLIPLLVYLLG